MYILTRGTFVFKIPMFENKLQHENSHEIPRVHTVWSHKYVKSTMTSLFDSIGTLTLITIGHESSKSVYFPAFLENPVHRKFYFLKQYRI